MQKSVTATQQEYNTDRDIQEKEKTFGDDTQGCHIEEYGGLKIFFFGCPLQNIFFFTGEKTISLLIDFVQNFINSFLGDV